MRGPDERARRQAVARVTGIVVATSLLAAACAGDDDEADAGTDAAAVEEATGAVRDVSEQGEPVEGGSITIGLEAETNGWTPGEASFANSGTTVAYALYDPLMKRDAEGEVRPYLARSMAPDADFTAWTLTLREDVTFHDGTVLDAHALKRNFDDYLTVPGATTLGSLDDVEMEVVDDLTVRYVLPAPDSSFPTVLTQSAGFPFSPTAAAANGADAMANPVGTGPFVFESWQRDSRLVVSRNESYWQEGLPYLDEIVFRPIPDEATRVASLTSGEVDAIQSLRAGTIVDLRAPDGIDNYEQVGNNAGVTILNTEEPPVDDVRVRRALAMAGDQRQAIEVLGGAGIMPPATQLFGPDSPYYSAAVAERAPDHDPEAAAEELQSYVDDPDRSDGRAPGEPVSVRFDCPPDPSLIELSQLLQASWNAVGFDVELRQVEQAAHVSEALSGDYQAKCFRAGSDRDPAVILGNAFGEDSTTNFTRFTDPQITESIAALRATDDLAERQALVEEIMMIVNENVPLLYAGNTLSVVATQDHVKNVDGWTYPDGTAGGTARQGTVVWANVWTTG